MDYIAQTDEVGSSCSVVTLCNALRFFGKPSPVPGSPEFHELRVLSGALHGTALNSMLDKVALKVGLIRKPLPSHEERTGFDIGVFPVDLTVVNPTLGCYLHSILVIGLEPEGLVMINYRCDKGPLVEAGWPDLASAAHNRKCWTFTLAQ